MWSKWQNDSISWMVLIGAFLLLLEVTFFNEGLIFSLFVSGTMIYFGRKIYERKTGKLLFWIGIFFFGSSVIGMVTFRLLLLAILIYLLIQFAKSKKKPDIIHPIVDVTEPEPLKIEEPVIEQSSLFKNTLFGHQQTPTHVYEWNDINIVTGVGDTVIDFSYTVLPKGETVIFIRNLIGDVTVYVPYDIEVNIRHSALVGSAHLLEFHNKRLFNEVLSIKTPGYEKAEQRIKIFTSMMIGDIEVKRI